MSVLPANSTKLELTMERIVAERLKSLDFNFFDLWNPEKCPEKYLYILAWTYNVTLWSDAWDTELKRKVISKWLEIRPYRGTKYAIREALATLGLRCDIREWYEYFQNKEENVFDVYVWADDNDVTKLENLRDLVFKVTRELKPINAICNVNFGVREKMQITLSQALKVTTIKRITMKIKGDI